MKELFNCDLNMITMYGKCAPVREKKPHRHAGENYLKDGNLKGYVLANDLRKELGVGAVKLKRLFESVGIERKYNRSVTYYPERAVQQIKDILSEHPVIKPIDKARYISTQELMQLFNYTTDKAFHIIRKEKPVKTRFGGRVNYYEKDSIIEIFNRYKKK